MGQSGILSKSELCKTIEFMIKTILADKAYQYKKVSKNLIIFSGLYIILIFSATYIKLQNLWLVFLMLGLFFSVFFVSLFPNIVDVNDYLEKVQDFDVIEEDAVKMLWPPVTLFAFLCTTFESAKYLYINGFVNLCYIAAVMVLPYFILFCEMLENEKKARECEKELDTFVFKEKEYEELVQHGYYYYVPAGFMVKLGDVEMAGSIMKCNEIRDRKEEEKEK